VNEISDNGNLKWARIAGFALGAAALGYCAYEAWQLYTQPAPFHQMYYKATPQEDRAVTYRLFPALVGLPLAVIVTIVAIRAPRIRLDPRRWLRVLAWILLLTAFQGCTACARFPYGFGSSYEHATAAQHFHMAIAGRTASVALVLAVFLFAITPKRRRARLPLPTTPTRS